MARKNANPNIGKYCAMYEHQVGAPADFVRATHSTPEGAIQDYLENGLPHEDEVVYVYRLVAVKRIVKHHTAEDYAGSAEAAP